MQIPDLLERTAGRMPDKAAIVSASEQMSFGALHVRSSQLASYLRRHGIGPGQRVAILHENSLAAVVLFWGVLKSGAQVVDVPCLAGGETVKAIIAEAKPSAIAVSARQRARLSASGLESLVRMVISEALLEETGRMERSDFHRPRASERDVALVIYTSGSTGKPKGVMLSHENLVSNIVAVNSVMRLTSDDSILCVVPLHFIHGRMQLLTHALIGGTVVFSSGFLFPQRVVDELVQYGTTGFSGVPYHYSTLLAHTTLASTPLPRLRYMVVTGGALSRETMSRLSSTLPGIGLYVGYGQTEASPRIATLTPSEAHRKPGSCGLPTPGVAVTILDDEGRTVENGTVGEVVVRGPNVMRGYVSGDEVKLGALDSRGQLHTGDLGKVDPEGYLYLVGRKSDLIKCAGERVFPQEIEAVLDAHPGVLESAALGLPDPVLGERIVACVVAKDGTPITPNELRSHCLISLPLVRAPREIRLCRAIPRTASGKMERHQLRDVFEAAATAGEASATCATSGSAPSQSRNVLNA